jgi:hypothetical protein
MNWRQFFSLRNERVILFFVFGIIGAGFIGQQYFPGRTFELAIGTFGPFFAFIIYMELQPLVVGKSHKHIDLTLWVPGDPARDWHFDLYLTGEQKEEGPTQPFFDIFALMEKDPRALRILRIMGGRMWYPYLRQSLYPLDIPGYGMITKFGLVLPHPWTKFLAFTEREYGAYITGTQYTHPGSVHMETVLAPFHLDILGDQIPIFIAVSSSYTIKTITESWTPTMNELARHFSHFKQIMDKHNDKVFPNADIEDTAANALDPTERALLKVELAKAKKELRQTA